MQRKGDPNDDMLCSFCGKSQDDVKSLITGPAVYICDECVRLCSKKIPEQYRRKREKDVSEQLPKPCEIKRLLDKHVIEQERPKKTLSVAMHNHYKRIGAKIDMEGVEIQKSNILLVGPTGSGKTLLAQTLAKIVKVPLIIANATTLTEAGYVGESVENIILDLLEMVDYDVEAASRGIVYIDEIDKIARKSDSHSTTRDISGECVQQALLKIIEGTIASVRPGKGRMYLRQDFVKVNTNNILFICGGTFSGLDKIIRSRIGSKSMGFKSDIKNKQEGDINETMPLVQPEDLIKFGLLPEFIGRIPIIATLDDLSMDALVRTLTEPKNALVKQYKKLFELEGVELEFTNEAFLAVAKDAIKRKSGARGLRAILESVMLDIMYDLPNMTGVRACVVGEEVITTDESPLLLYEDQVRYA